MSKYTTEVRFICETAAGIHESTGFNSVNEVIQQAIPKVFDFDFPIYDENYRNVLCGKILKHYYTREIGLETVGLWKLHLDMRLNEIMPYYNQLYKSAMIDFNPMYDVELTTTMDKDTGGSTDRNDEDKTVNNYTDTRNVDNTNKTEYGRTTNTETEDSNNSTRRDLFSDTPQGSLDNVENETYLTNARKITDNFSSNVNTNSREGGSDTTTNNGTETITRTGDGTTTKIGKTTIKTTEDYTMKVIGKNGGVSYSKLLQEFRNTFINIDMQVINALSDLFFGLW